MKSFRTEIQSRSSAHRIKHQLPVFTIGSCFADSIGNSLKANKFSAFINPFGTLYNPVSIHKVLSYAIHNELPLPDKYIQSGEVWYNYDFHSSLSGTTRGDIEKIISNTIGSAHHLLRTTATLIITYGTAKVFELAESGEPVANCHKIPSVKFSPLMLTPEQIVESFKGLFKKLQDWNSQLKIILTLSPVRHVKETLEINSASKSVLRWACHAITESCPGVEYFPAFEIMMDDLRDYRFYEEDMIHPSKGAIDYIWDKFSETYFDSSTRSLIKQWQDVATALHHRPFHPKSLVHKKFLKETLLKLEELSSIIPVNDEIALIQSQL